MNVSFFQMSKNLEKALHTVLRFEFEEKKKLRGVIAETSQRRKGTGLFQTEPTGQGTPSSSDEEVGSSQRGTVRTPLTRRALASHVSLPYSNVRGPKKTVQKKL